tara:strand:- start:8784 stop:11156 length:2373 start_codon:yes stop_codon:yes gene_type:complete
MKTKLLLLFTLISALSYAQTFDWETGTLLSFGSSNQNVIAQQIVGGYTVNFSATGTSTPILLGAFGQGTTGEAVMNQQPQQLVRLSFSPAVDIQSLKAFSANSGSSNWTFTPINSSGDTVVTSNVAQNAVTVNLNWTNVSIIDISLTNGGTQNFGIDDIVFTPYVATCTVNIPDANFKAYLVGNTAINTNGDTEIQCTEASAFSGTINVNNGSISDLTGIEAFTALTELFCANNQLITLDPSANTALITLSCNNNQLTSIDISNNTSLTALRCDTNQLTSLDVSNNTALESLVCFSNLLTSLDVSVNTALTTLDCSYNSLASLDVSANTALTTLICRTNQLTSLDVSNNTDLIFLNCFDTQLTNLDFSANIALTTIFCGDNTQLISLNVANGNDTNVVNFNTTNTPNLTCIQVDDVAYSTTNWTSIDAASSFSTNCVSAACTVTIPDANFKAYLVGNAAINTNGDTEIQCSEAIAFTGFINIEYQNVSDLTGIEAFINMTSFRCNNNNNLASLNLSANTAITYIKCDNNGLTSINLSGLTNLETLDCYNNSLTNLDVSGFTVLSYLNCYDNSLTSLNVSGATALESIYCYNNNLTNIDVSTNTNLLELACANNNLTSLNVSGATALEQLNCSENSITSLDVSANTNLYDIIVNNNALISLNLANGNNAALTSFIATSNAALSCIKIDAGFTPPSNWQKDATASYSDDCAALSVDDFTVQNISIYPNPVNNTLNIQLEDTLEKVEVYSILGAKVIEHKNSSINVSKLASGLYLLKVYTEEGKVGVKRFIKQ